jgi:hypothetical protein
MGTSDMVEGKTEMSVSFLEESGVDAAARMQFILPPPIEIHLHHFSVPRWEFEVAKLDGIDSSGD